MEQWQPGNKIIKLEKDLKEQHTRHAQYVQGLDKLERELEEDRAKDEIKKADNPRKAALAGKDKITSEELSTKVIAFEDAYGRAHHVFVGYKETPALQQ